MVTSLVCAALVFATPVQQQRQNLLYRLVPHPTGANGYEEYLKAAEVASDPACLTYEDWMPNADPPDATGGLAFRNQLVRRLNTMNVLSVRQEQSRMFGGALDLVRQGNTKAIIDPRSILTPESIFPELGYFKRIARLFTGDAYTKFADGNSSAATKDYVDGLTFAYNISNGPLISSLVGVAVTSILIADCSDRLPNLALDDCRALQRISQRLLAAPMPVVTAMEVERRGCHYIIDKVLSDDKGDLNELLGADSQEEGGLISRMRKATPAEKRRWANSCGNIIDSFYASIQGRLRQPEANWFGVDDDMEASLAQEADPVVRSFLAMISPALNQACLAIARSRTQVRLLNLHAKVLEFHWLYNRFPTRLSELGSTVSLKDPLSGEDFVYEPRSGGYRLYSKGVKQTGEIELRYKGPMQTESNPNPN